MGLENFECGRFMYEEIEHLDTNFLVKLSIRITNRMLSQNLNQDPDMQYLDRVVPTYNMIFGHSHKIPVDCI